MYSIDTTNWTSIAPPASSSSTQWPPAMQGHGAVFRKATEELYIVGGTRQDQSFVSEVWKWSMRNMAWEVVSTIGGGPVRRKNHAVAMVDDKFMFVWGGQDDSANIQNDLWRLDLTTSTWSQLTPAAGPTPPASSFSNLLALSPTSLLLFGGNTGTRDLSTLHIYSITSNTWSPIFSSSSFAPPALSKATGVVLDARRIMIVGGNSNGDMKNGVYIFNHVKEEWTGEAASSKLPYELQGMTSVAFKQSDSRNACEFTKDYDVCKPDNRTMLLMYGGTRRDGGSISGLLATFPPVEPEEKPLQYVQTLILSIGYTIAGIGIILSILSLIATLIYRKTPAFRSASPTFLTLYALGALCAFGGIIAYNLPVNPNPKSASSMTCRTGLWMFSEGCMLVFSAMVVKNWRIHFIFMRSRSSRVAVVKDGVLIAVVAALMIVNTGVLSAFSVMSPYEIGSVVVDGEVWPICTASKMGLWLWILIAPPGLVLLYGVFVSFSTRNVTSKFNESFQINLAIYATVLSLIVLVPLSLTIKLPPTLHVINSLLTCLTLCTVIGSNFFAKTYNAVFKSQRVFDLGPSGGTGGRGTTSDEGGETTQEEVLCCRTCTQPLKQRMSTGQNLQLSNWLLHLRGRPLETLGKIFVKKAILFQPVSPCLLFSFLV
ncbi:hypothetical protein BC829DRAFT_41828 [Chytridium lagenaria]|nr:hypothetical protein BC829DRAFT_41828 [Chytridium lagenaria]